MKRKMIKQGGGGFTVYLPKKWADKNKLSQGDEIEIEEIGKDLIIHPSKSKKSFETKITLTNITESSIRTAITNAYRKGYEKIEVLLKDKKQLELLNEIIKTKLIGFEIIKKEGNKCTIENITEPSKEQFETILKKVFLNIDELFSITKKRLNGENNGIHEDYNEIEERIMKYDNFCRRIILKERIITSNPELFWSFLSLVMYANREIYHLNNLIKKKFHPSKELIDILNGAHKMFKLVEEAYFKKKIENLGEIHQLEKELIYKKVYKFLETKTGEENKIVYHLSVCIRELYKANSPLTGILI